MRIKYFIGSATSGNSETFIRKCIADMRELGWSVEVISGRRSGSADDVQYVGFSESNWALRIWRLFAFLKFTGLAQRYDFVGYRIRQRVATTKLAPFFKGEDDFYWFDYLNYACYAARVLNETETPYAIAVHGYDASQELSDQFLRRAAVSLRPEFVVAPSNHLKRRLELIGMTARIHVIPYDSAPAVEADHAEKYDFIALGRMTPKKCPEAVLMAFEKVLTKHPKATLIWVGGGELESEVNSRFAHLADSGNVIFKGMVGHEEALHCLMSSKVFVQHSVTSGSGDQEGLPNSIVEAMRNGKPVVSTIHSGIPEIVSHGVNGYLVQEHDYESFADFMSLLLEDGKLRAAMSQSARTSVDERIPLGSRGSSINTLILSAIERN